MQSRYYDPQVGRFINADDVDELNFETVGGLNIYSYCGNCPTMNVDPSGRFFISLILIGLAIGATVAFGTSVVSQGIQKGWDNINWGQVALDTVICGISGALSATGIGFWASVAIGAGLGFVGGIGSALINGESLLDGKTWHGIGVSTVIGGVSAAIGGAGAKNAKALYNNVRPTANLINATNKYTGCLARAANGGYKNLAGAAGAKYIYTMALNTAWKEAVKKQITRNLYSGLVKSSFTSISLTIGLGFINK